jgi:hypothetical protein
MITVGRGSGPVSEAFIYEKTPNGIALLFYLQQLT